MAPDKKEAPAAAPAAGASTIREWVLNCRGWPGEDAVEPAVGDPLVEPLDVRSTKAARSPGEPVDETLAAQAAEVVVGVQFPGREGRGPLDHPGRQEILGALDVLADIDGADPAQS